MRAILKSTGERGFAHQDETTGRWYFSAVRGRALYGIPVQRSQLILFPVS